MLMLDVLSVSEDCEKLELPLLLEERLKAEWTQQEIFLQSEDLQRKYRRVKFTGTMIRPLCNIILLSLFAPGRCSTPA